MSVFCGSCASPTCIGGNDDFCGLQSQVSWCSEAGSTYLILVHGFSSNSGDFEIVVTDDGSPCAGAVECNPVGGANDLCDDATDLGALPASVSGTTVGATPDDLVAPTCGTTVTAPGVWYSFVGSGNTVIASLCNGTSYDSKISAYTGTCDALECVAGNDDFCGLQSEITFCANTGVTYYILVHGFSSNSGGFNLDVIDTGAPCECDDVCEAGDIPEGEPTCFDEYDDTFNGGCNSASPVFSDIACGDSVCGTSGTFLFTDPVFGLSEFRDTDWYRFDIASAQDVTFTATTGFPGLIGIVDTNGIDDCSLVTDFAASSFTDPCVETSVTATLSAGTWYVFVSTADFSGVACGSPYHAELSCVDLPTGACCVAGVCMDGVAEVECEAMDGLYQGDLTGCDDVTCPVPPANDLCEDAIGPLSVPSTTPGTTILANIDLCDGPDPFCTDCGAAIVTSPGVWYTVIGTGNTMTAGICNGVATFDSKLSVFCGTCDEPTCIDGNDDSCGLQSEVTWCSQAGAEYLILVHGFGGATGDFELEITDDGAACGGAIGCLPEGACCLADESCVVTTQIGCDALGGDYSGDDVQCAGSGYTVSDCNSDFEDISGTGTLIVLGDEVNANNIPLGFTFEFYGLNWNDISFSDNGFLSFEFLSGSTFSNQDIPDTDSPNNLIAPYWDDLDTAVGSVHYQTLGTAPNRRFVAQWTDVPQFFNTDSNTFQAVLYEGSNAIEFRYGLVSGPSFDGDVTIGIESPGGTDAVSVDAAGVGEGDCLRFENIQRPDPCNEPPDCPTGVVIEIWPPNHEAYPIDMTTDAGISDPDGDDLVITITSITQDEPINGNGDGNTSCDAGWTGTDAYVRRERAGGGDGRVYHINYTVDDGRGGTCSGTLLVAIPKSQNGNPAVDSGQNYDSTPCFGKTDVNADGVTDLVDMEIVINNYGQAGPDIFLNWPDGDVNGDARTDALDLALVIRAIKASGGLPGTPQQEELDGPISPNQEFTRDTSDLTFIGR